MSLLRFYMTSPVLSWGDSGKKKRKQIENDDEKQKKKREYEKKSSWQEISLKMANRATLDWSVFSEEKNVMICTTCIEFFQSDKISNPFISGCSNLRASADTDHEQSKNLHVSYCCFKC